VPLPLWLNGRQETTSRTDPVIAPFGGRVLAEVHQATPEHIESAITAMAASFPALKSRPSHARAATCRKIHDQLQTRAEEFARTIANEAGKPIRTARGEVARALTTFRLAVEEATRIAGEQLPVDIDPRSEGYWALIERFPIGPCSFITPFNFPLNLVAHKVAPALAAGCPFIVKPSERTPLTALLLGELLAACDLPEGSWHILPCDRTTARPLVTDDRIKLLSFTGSPSVGFAMKADAGKKPVLLELGNASAVIVEPDANLAVAIPRIVAGAFSYAGQSCISVQRLYVHESIATEATTRLLAATAKLKCGDPLDESTDVGPVIDNAAADRLQKWIADSRGEVLCGNTRKENLLTPTLIKNPAPHSPLLTEEAFGPVLTLQTYTNFEDALQKSNNTPFGLQAGIFTNDIQKARHAFETLDMGGVIINDVPTTRIDNMPYGGLKNSGLGREGPKYAIHHMTEPKLLLIRK
jgi:acyl-CoA reductase-like NAD-dependent aldehyde dehydrogenase